MRILILISIILISYSLSAKKIVVLGATTTEIIAELESQKEVVACDSWSKDVEGMTNATDLGEFPKFDYNKIKSLNPDIIIVDAEISRFGVKEELDKLNLKVEYLPYIFSKKQIEKNIETIAKLVGKSTQYDKTRDMFRIKYAEYEVMLAMNSINSKVIYLDTDYNGGVVIAGNNTAPNAILKLAGNKLKIQQNDWQKITIEEINKLNPNVIFVSDKLVSSLGGSEKAIKFFASTNAGKKDKIAILESWELRNFGYKVSEILLKVMGTFNENGF